MKLRFLLATFFIGPIAPWIGLAQDAAPPPAAATAASPSPAAELQALVGQIQTKLKAGEDTAAALAPEIAAFDALLAKYQGQKTDETAQILLMKATLFLQVFEDNATGRTLLEQIKTDFPGTRPALMVDRILAQLAATEKAEQAKAALVGQPAPDLTFKWASRDGLATLSGLKGKVVILDFWATWCGPCVSSFPQVRELTKHYEGLDVEVIGVTSLQGRVLGLEAQPINTEGAPDREMELMKDYIKAKDITWTIAFSEQEVFNPDYGITGIPYMAIIAPDGTVRHTGLHPAMPSPEKYEMIDAILKEFDMKLPANATKS